MIRLNISNITYTTEFYYEPNLLHGSSSFWVVTTVIHIVLRNFCISEWHICHCAVRWKIHYGNHFLFPCFCLYIHCGSVNAPMWDQYAILDFHEVINKGVMWILHVQTHSFQGSQLDSFYSQTTVLCGIGKKIVGRGVTCRSYLVWLICGRTGYHSLMVQLV